MTIDELRGIPWIGVGYNIHENARLPRNHTELYSDAWNVIGSMQFLELGIAGYKNDPRWQGVPCVWGESEEHALFCLLAGAPRLWAALPQWRDDVRNVHKPNVPILGGKTCTSYLEATIALAGDRLHYLNRWGKWGGGPELRHPQMREKTAIVAKHADEIIEGWKIEWVDHWELLQLVELELSWVAREQGKAPSNRKSGLTTEWIHRPGEAVPPQFGYGPVSGTRRRLGYALRPNEDRDKSDRSHADFLRAQAEIENPKIYVVDNGGKSVNVFFTSPVEMHAAENAVATCPKRKQTEANGSEVKRIHKKQSRAKPKRRG